MKTKTLVFDLANKDQRACGLSIECGRVPLARTGEPPSLSRPNRPKPRHAATGEPGNLGIIAHYALEGLANKVLANKVLAREYRTVLPSEKLLAQEIKKVRNELRQRENRPKR
jgi:hypothetical protein